MKVSFVIPAYNEAGRIRPCLESVQKEITRAGVEKDAEIIVVNNASIDNTAQVASTYAGVRVVDEPHKGLPKARQAGFNASSGELIANVDADTIMPPGWLDVVLREFARDPELVALSGPFIYYDLPPLQRLLSKFFISFYVIVHFVIHSVLHVGAILQGGNFVLRRAALIKVGGYDTSIEFYGEDVDIARRIAKIGRVKWSLRLFIYTSGRRFTQEGLARMGLRYAVNFFSTTFTGKPYTRTHADIQTK